MPALTSHEPPSVEMTGVQKWAGAFRMLQDISRGPTRRTDRHLPPVGFGQVRHPPNGHHGFQMVGSCEADSSADTKAVQPTKFEVPAARVRYGVGHALLACWSRRLEQA
jgi:hypothetical protein